MRHSLPLALAVLIGITLTGCSDPTSAAVYEGEQTEKDRLPQSVVDDSEAETYDLDSARFLGNAKERDFYAVRAEDGMNCIAMVPQDPKGWHVGCGAGGGTIGFGGGGVNGEFNPGGFTADSLRDGWISVHPSLRIEG